MTKQEMEKEIRALRHQMVMLKNAMKMREDKLLKVIELIEPFMPFLLKTEEEQKQFLKDLEDNYPESTLE